VSAANFYDYTMGHARLTVLRTLTEAIGYATNDSVLYQVMQSFGLPLTRDQLRTQLGWLEEQGLVTLTRPTEGVLVARLRERGADVAEGRAHVEGVQRPSASR
jgi:hypothetical protein